jgi:hypothetical protein
MPSAARSKSAVSSTMIASLPPSSKKTRLIHRWPGARRLAAWLIQRPTSRLPVKLMNRVLGCSTR